MATNRIIPLIATVSVLTLLPGCFLFGTYPAAREFTQELDEQPKAIDDFAALYPDARDVTFYRSGRTKSGLIDSEHTYGYIAHFRMGEKWFVADFDANGELQTLKESMSDFTPDLLRDSHSTHQ